MVAKYTFKSAVKRSYHRNSTMSKAEIMLIMILFSRFQQVEHSRHRCFDNFIVNMLGAIAAYCCFPKKPCINVERTLDTQLTLF